MQCSTIKDLHRRRACYSDPPVTAESPRVTPGEHSPLPHSLQRPLAGNLASSARVLPVAKASDSFAARAASCHGCHRIIDMRCHYFRRTAYYHRVADCIAPLWGGMTAQLHRYVWSKNQTMQHTTCLLGEADVIGVYADALGVLDGVRFVDANVANGSSCRTNLVKTELRLPDRTNPVYARSRCPSNACCSCTAHSWQSGALLRDLASAIRVAAAAHQWWADAHSGRQIVLITRLSPSITSSNLASNGSRHFDPASLILLGESLRSLPESVLTEYAGHEDIRSTLALFGRARAVVGVHGAGHVNALFAVNPCVVIEIGTWLDHERHVSWRSNAALEGWTRMMHWMTHRVPIVDFLRAVSELERERFWRLARGAGGPRDKALMTVSKVRSIQLHLQRHTSHASRCRPVPFHGVLWRSVASYLAVAALS
jgi:hypothetical protein